VYKTKTANAAIKSDILGFLVQRAVSKRYLTFDSFIPYYFLATNCQIMDLRVIHFLVGSNSDVKSRKKQMFFN